MFSQTAHTLQPRLKLKPRQAHISIMLIYPIYNLRKNHHMPDVFEDIVSNNIMTSHFNANVVSLCSFSTYAHTYSSESDLKLGIVMMARTRWDNATALFYSNLSQKSFWSFRFDEWACGPGCGLYCMPMRQQCDKWLWAQWLQSTVNRDEAATVSHSRTFHRASSHIIHLLHGLMKL